MSVVEIVLLIVGAAVFVLSFFIPDKNNKRESRIDKKAIDAAVDESIGNVKGRLEAVVDEAVSYAIEKSERLMERVTNEKLGAVDEYAGSVLESINKNHQEVMFLYDMVNNKSVELKNTVREAQAAQAETKTGIARIAEAAQAALNNDTKDNVSSSSGVDEVAAISSEDNVLRPLGESVPVVSIEQYEEKEESAQEEILSALNIGSVGATYDSGENEGPSLDIIKPKSEKKAKKSAGDKAPMSKGKVPTVDITMNSNSTTGNNKNEMILKLHRMGKSNVEVARELGLGMGEVKLVIDLFEGSK